MDIRYILLFVIGIFFIALLIYFWIKSKYTRFSSKDLEDFEVLEITLSRNEEASTDVQLFSLAAENMFALIHGLLKEDSSAQEHLSFEIVSSGIRGITFYVAVPRNVLKFVEGQIYAQYPEASIRVTSDHALDLVTEDKEYEVATLRFSKPNFFPIKTFRDFETDPLSAFSSSLAQVKEDDEIWFQIVTRPVADIWQEGGFSYVKAIREGLGAKPPSLMDVASKVFVSEIQELAGMIATGLFKYKEESPPQRPGSSGPSMVRLTPIQELEIRSIENKLGKIGFETIIRILSVSKDKDRVDSNLRSVIASLKQYTTSSSNTFKIEIASDKKEAVEDMIKRSFDDSKSQILSGEELATLFHFPSSNIETPTISWSYSKKSEPPSNLPVKDCVYIGDTMYRSKKIRFGLANDDDRLRHMYVIGKSGVGKSTLFESMITQDIINGFGVCMLDPHGETIDKVLERIPDERIKDVIYFDPSDTENPIGLNLMELNNPAQKNLMASGLLSAIKQHFDYSWGPRLEYLLNYAILTLIEVPGTTMLGITRLLEDKNYRNYIMHNVKDPVIRRFWEKEFKELSGNQRFITEAISPIQNKVNRFLASTTIRNVLGQAKSTLDIWDAMQNNKILLINLSKGKIGSDNANLLGALIVSRIQFFALQRSNIPYEERKPFYLYVDEFQNFATGSFEEILSESRKYKLGLYLTHQFTAQLPEELLKSVLGNVGTIINFSSGALDARIMANEFMPHFEAEDIITLEKFYVYIKLMIDGMTSLPFSARILIPWEDTGGIIPPKTGNKEKVIAYSREKYGVSREYVEAKVDKWINTLFDKGLAVSQEYKEREKGRQEGTQDDKIQNEETKI